MHGTCKSNRFDIMALKRPTYLDKLIETVPKPRGAIPNFGLPKWKVMPLESKIPMVPGPEGAYNFTRQKIGKSIWVGSKDAEFNLNDPYCYEMKVTYDPLHDEHLMSFFAKPHNLRRLLDAGLITKDLSVKCSLRDYNVYRKFLRKLHTDSIRKELNKRALAFDEKRRKNPPYQAQIEANMLKRKERVTAFKRDREKIFKAREEKIKELQERADRVNERLRGVQIDKENRLRSLFENRATHYDQFRQKLRTATYLGRLKVIRTLTRWKRKERKSKKESELRAMELAEEKRKAIEEKWMTRQEFQKEQIEKESFLLQCITEQQGKFLEEYNEKVNAEREKMKKRFEETKLFVTCLLSRQLAEGQKRVCCKLLEPEKQLSPEEEIRRLLCRPKSQLTTAQQRRLRERKESETLKELERNNQKQTQKPTQNETQTQTQKHAKKRKLTQKQKQRRRQRRRKNVGHRRKMHSKKRKRKLRKDDGMMDAESQVEKDDEFDRMSSIRDQSESPEQVDIWRDKCRCEITKAAGK